MSTKVVVVPGGGVAVVDECLGSGGNRCFNFDLVLVPSNGSASTLTRQRHTEVTIIIYYYVGIPRTIDQIRLHLFGTPHLEL